jgi:ATP-binding cassette, subfamily B, bacterial
LVFRHENPQRLGDLPGMPGNWLNSALRFRPTARIVPGSLPWAESVGPLDFGQFPVGTSSWPNVTAEATPISSLTTGLLVIRLCALAWRHRWICLWVLTLQLAITALQLAVMFAAGLAIDLIHWSALPSVAALPWPIQRDWLVRDSAMAWIAGLAGLLGALSLVRAVLQYAYAVASGRLVHERLIAGLRAQVYDRLQRLSFRFFDQHSSSSLINRVTGDVAALRLFVDGVLLQLAIVLLSLGFCLAYMLCLHPRLTAVCLAPTPLLWIASAWFARRVRPEYDRNRALVDQLVLTLSENVQGVQVVKSCGIEQQQSQQFAVANARVRGQQQRIFWLVSLYTPAMALLTHVNLALLLGYGGWLTIRGEFPLGTGLVVFAGLLQQFANQITSFGNIANTVQQSLAGARRVFEILDRPLEVETPAAPRHPQRTVGAIRLEQVTFGYEPQRPVLREITLDIAPGEFIAVLGATGAGKSSLLGLIPRFYDVTAGRVLVDGADVREWDLGELRRQIGVVPQEAFLFSHTIGNNVAYARPQASQELVVQAVQEAAAGDFVADLPRRLETLVGERGNSLSGGQRQRLAVARALLAEPKILLLDDPASALDADTETQLLNSLLATRGRRTMVVVTNQRRILLQADRVVVLAEGQIVQIGSPQELRDVPGPFRETIELGVPVREEVVA